VVGLGLMGGSWAGAARPLVGTLHGCDRAPEARAGALARGLVDAAWEAPGPWLGHCDLVVLAVPPGVAGEMARSCLDYMKAGSILTDVCSVKEAVVAEVAPLLEGRGVSYVPGHPLAGKERSGLDAACPDLFRGAPYVLCDPLPSGRAEPAWQELAVLVRAMGARPVRVGPDDHDRLVAASSHLPYLVAVAMTRVVGAVQAGGVPATALVSSGFRDTTRVALSPPDLWADILVRNPALGEVARMVLAELQMILGVVREEPGELARLLEEGRAVRDRIDRQRPEYERHGLPRTRDCPPKGGEGST